MEQFSYSGKFQVFTLRPKMRGTQQTYAIHSVKHPKPHCKSGLKQLCNKRKLLKKITSTR